MHAAAAADLGLTGRARAVMGADPTAVRQPRQPGRPKLWIGLSSIRFILTG